MAKLIVTGRLGSVKNVGADKKYVSFGVAEPAYKNKEGQYVTPWYNFLVDAESATGKYLSAHADKLDVIRVTAEQRQDKENSNKVYNNNVVVDRITTKAAVGSKEATSAETSTEDSAPSVDEQPIADIEDGLEDFF